MDSQTRKVLGEVFGFNDFRPGQVDVVERLLAGRSVLAIFPTGGGKSLCYQLPALLLEGLTVVISPLIALMKDQIDFLRSRGAPAARLDSSMEREEVVQVFEELNAGRLRLLYVAPERLGNERFLQSLGRRRIALLAVDEAHCISEWGHNFRPDYLKIARMARELGVGRVLALTATATPPVAADIAAGFGIAREDVIQTGFYRPNLRLFATPSTANGRSDLLVERLRSRPPGPTIVYVTLQRTAEEVAARLVARGFDAQAYHAGMEAEDRHAIQDAFMASPKMIVVATIAFGMGIDKSNIRYIYHYNLPKALENYAQEIGRAGRDGETSICELFACADDVVTLENFSYGDTPTPEAVSGILADVLGRGDEFAIAENELATQYDVRPLVVRTLLTYLELDDVIRSTGAFYSQYKFQPQKSSQEILGQFDAARAEFLRSIFRQAVKGKTWFSLDVDEAARRIDAPRQRVVAALGYLEENGLLVVEASGVRQAYRRCGTPAEAKTLANRLSERFLLREKQDIARVRGMLGLAEADGCLTRYLLAHFGETRADCGHCGHCEGQPRVPLAPARYTKPDAATREKIAELHRARHRALGTPRQMTRFLCGLASPASTRAKLRSHPLFGILGDVPFHEVLALAEAVNGG